MAGCHVQRAHEPHVGDARPSLHRPLCLLPARCPDSPRHFPPDISPYSCTWLRCAAKPRRMQYLPRWRPWWRPRRSVPAASAPPAAMACCSAACCSPAAKTRSNCRRRLRVRRRQRQALASHDLLRMRCAAVTLCAANSLPHSCHRVAPRAYLSPPGWPGRQQRRPAAHVPCPPHLSSPPVTKFSQSPRAHTVSYLCQARRGRQPSVPPRWALCASWPPCSGREPSAPRSFTPAWASC